MADPERHAAEGDSPIFAASTAESREQSPPPRKSGQSPARLAREKRTIRAMIGLYCRAHHATGGPLCAECQTLYDYALARLDRCPLGAAKTTCARCTVHCYKPAMREQVKEVMRYAGPRMIFRHPVLAVMHWVDAFRGR